MSEYTQKLANAIKNTRMELGWTQEELAEKSEVYARTIINMEQGRGNPKLKTLFAVIRALNLDAREIFEDNPECESPTMQHLRMILEECSESEAATLIPVLEAILTALRSGTGTKIKSST